MMKEKCLVMTALLLSSMSAFAQNLAGSFTVQPQVGFNSANLVDNRGNTDTDWKLGLVVGVEGEYYLKNWLGISAGLLYSQQGTKGDFTYDGQKLNGNMKLDYLNVPILANFHVAKGLALKVGVQPGFRLKATTKLTMGNVGVDYDMDDINALDVSLPLGISYEYAGFCLDARYNYGVTYAVKDIDYRNSVFQLTIGYKFKL